MKGNLLAGTRDDIQEEDTILVSIQQFEGNEKEGLIWILRSTRGWKGFEEYMEESLQIQ